jgi:hypothetical protein
MAKHDLISLARLRTAVLLRPLYLQFLQTLRRQGPSSSGEIAEGLGIPSEMIERAATDLQESGVVVRNVERLELSTLGQDLLVRIWRSYDGIQAAKNARIFEMKASGKRVRLPKEPTFRLGVTCGQWMQPRRYALSEGGLGVSQRSAVRVSYIAWVVDEASVARRAIARADEESAPRNNLVSRLHLFKRGGDLKNCRLIASGRLNRFSSSGSFASMVKKIHPSALFSVSHK